MIAAEADINRKYKTMLEPLLMSSYNVGKVNRQIKENQCLGEWL